MLKFSLCLSLLAAVAAQLSPCADILSTQYPTLNLLLNDRGITLPTNDYTIFAPVEAAFTQPVLDLYASLSPPGQTALLEGHILGTAVSDTAAFQLSDPRVLTQGGTPIFVTNDGTLFINSANVVQPEQCLEGWIHGIDSVISFKFTLRCFFHLLTTLLPPRAMQDSQPS